MRSIEEIIHDIKEVEYEITLYSPDDPEYVELQEDLETLHDEQEFAILHS